MERKNFYASAHVLKDIWSQTVINNYPVICQVLETGSELIPEEPDAFWVFRHVRQHRYGLQIVKCLDESCCGRFETNWLNIFPERFIPPTAVYQYGATGLEIVEPSVYLKEPRKYKFATLPQRLIAKLVPKEGLFGKNGEKRPVPFDLYCPSMQDKIENCVCKQCGIYWPSAAAKNRHQKIHKIPGADDTFVHDQGFNLAHDEVLDEFETDSETEEEKSDPDCPMPVFSDLKKHITSPFVQLWLEDDAVEDD